MNNFSKEGIYLFGFSYWERSIEEVSSPFQLTYIETGTSDWCIVQEYGHYVSKQTFVDGAFGNRDEILVAIWSKETIDNWQWDGNEHLTDHTLQKYWFRKEDVISEDGESFKWLTFPPNPDMKDVKMDPPYGTYAFPE